MLKRIVGAVATAWMIGTPTPAASQTIATAITFTLPLNLTQLSSDLEKVRFICAIGESSVFKYPPLLLQSTSSGNFDNWFAKQDLPVVAGQLVATMSVVHPIAPEWFVGNPSGQTADYTCFLMGFSRSRQTWGAFSETTTDPTYLLKPAPQGPMQGTFKW